MIYELINPSDSYTMRADAHVVACCAALLLGEGAYGLREVDGEFTMPVFLLGGWAEWWKAMFGTTITESLDANTAAITACLESLVIGSAADRDAYETGLRLITDDVSRATWRKRWVDQRRSSLNNIGARAEELVALLKVRAAKQ